MSYSGVASGEAADLNGLPGERFKYATPRQLQLTEAIAEHLDIAGAILAEPCHVADGKVRARGPSLGIQWDEEAIKRYAA
jgi:hypothetical protein